MPFYNFSAFQQLTLTFLVSCYSDCSCDLQQEIEYSYVISNERELSWFLSTLHFLLFFCEQLELKMYKKQLKVELFFFLRHFT